MNKHETAGFSFEVGVIVNREMGCGPTSLRSTRGSLTVVLCGSVENLCREVHCTAGTGTQEITVVVFGCANNHTDWSYSSCTIVGVKMPAANEAQQSPTDYDPFRVLVNANSVLLANFRRDEATPELNKQLRQTGMPPSAQAYFCEPYANAYLGPQV